MPVDRPFHAEPLRILAVAESDAAAAAIVTALGDEFAGSVRLSVEPSIADASPAGTEVVLLALDSLVACERRARALQAEAGAEAPLLIAVCRTAELAAAARLARAGVVDDYVLHPLESGDPGRLAASVRMAGRLARERGWAPVELPPRPPLVLLVEDDEFAHQLVAATLEAHDLALVVETDGEAALDRIAELRPDLILMDVNLPGSDGVTLTQHLKRDAALAAIPVVMFTGEASREVLLRSLDAGAADFIVKPFTPEALMAKLRRFLPSLR